MKYKISIIGHFGFGHALMNGQTIKTEIWSKSLKDFYGSSNVNEIDSRGGLKTLIKSPIIVWRALSTSKNVFLLTAHNGIKVFIPLLVVMNYFFKRKIHYSVIGGWLPKVLENRRILHRLIKKIDYIYVETNTMNKKMKALGIHNTIVVPNCKELSIVSDFQYTTAPPYKLCTFSRINRLKGIEEAINVVNRLNDDCGRIICTLDIYGKVDSGEENWFDEIKQNFNSAISYCGCVDFTETTNVIKKYFLLLFPTRYFTEGIPGTIVDAYSAGVPVISSRWESSSDIIEENNTGFCFDFNNEDDFYYILKKAIEHPEMVESMKKNCILKAQSYTVKSMMEILSENIV